MIDRREEEGGDEEEIGRMGGEESMAVQASFKGPGTGHPLTSKTLIQKRCLLPWVFVFPNRGGGDGLTKSNEEKKIPTRNFLPNSNKPRIEPRFSWGEGSASVVRSFALQQHFLLLATVSAAVFQTGLELKIEMAHAVDVTPKWGSTEKCTPFAHPAAGGREFPITQLSSQERRMRDAGLAMVGVDNL